MTQITYAEFMGDDTFPAEEEFELASQLLDFFLWGSPTSMIPSVEIVTKWREALVARGADFASLVAECDEWLVPPDPALLEQWAVEDEKMRKA